MKRIAGCVALALALAAAGCDARMNQPMADRVAEEGGVAVTQSAGQAPSFTLGDEKLVPLSRTVSEEQSSAALEAMTKAGIAAGYYAPDNRILVPGKQASQAERVLRDVQ